MVKGCGDSGSNGGVNGRGEIVVAVEGVVLKREGVVVVVTVLVVMGCKDVDGVFKW